MHLGVFTSHWNYPADMGVLYDTLIKINPLFEPYLVAKVSEGVGKYNDGIAAAVNARDAGFKYIGPCHFMDRRYSPQKNAETFLSQWDKFNWTVRPSLDNELTAYMPNPTPVLYPKLVGAWYDIVDPKTTGKPGILYSNVSFVLAYLQDPSLTDHGLWLSQTASNPKVILGAPTVPLPWLRAVQWQKSFVNYLGKFLGQSSLHANVDECQDIRDIEV